MARTKTCERAIDETLPEKRYRFTAENGEDIFSRLPDDLIHKILSFVDIKQAVQTSALSRRWRPVWITLPSINLDRYEQPSPRKTINFFRNLLSKRNDKSKVLKLRLDLLRKLPGDLFEKILQYAFSHNVQHLDVHLSNRYNPCKLSTFSSRSVVNLTLCLKLEQSVQSQCWDLPFLTTLHLKWPGDINHKISESCLTSLPALTTLCLDSWDLRKSSLSFNLPNLTTLRMFMCALPETVWNFPALKSLVLNDVLLPDNMRTIFSTLVSLQNLSLFFNMRSIPDCFTISCPQLVNLNIGTRHTVFLFWNDYRVIHDGKIMVLAPKLRTFTSLGIFSIAFGVCELETVYIKLGGWIGHTDYISEEESKKYYEPFIFMFQGLGGAKILRLDSETIEALYEISNFLANFPSPFHNLKYVKIPDGYGESIISGAIRSYLLGGSPGATIVTTLPQFNDMQEKDVVEKSVMNVDRGRETDVPVEGGGRQ